MVTSSTRPERPPTGHATWRRRNPLIYRVHDTRRHGVRRGLLSPEHCAVCCEAKAEVHHSYFSRPLAVEWLCRRHHKAIHAKGEGRVVNVACLLPPRLNSFLVDYMPELDTGVVSIAIWRDEWREVGSLILCRDWAGERRLIGAVFERS